MNPIFYLGLSLGALFFVLGFALGFNVGVEKKKYLQDFITQKWFLVKIEQSTVDEDNSR